MIMCLRPKPRRAAAPGQNDPSVSARFRSGCPCCVARGFQPRCLRKALGRLSQRLGLTCRLGVALILAALTASAQGQSSVTLAWDPSAGSSIAGYRLYTGGASRTYTNVISAGNATAITVNGLTRGATYFFAVTAVGTNGLESMFSSEISYSVPWLSNIILTNGAGLTFAADSGTITAPFAAANGTVSQPALTDALKGGRAVYSFNILNAGNYLVSANVDAPNGGANSFFVNIDDEPTDPYMVWSIPVTTGLQSRTVSWQGNVTLGSPEFAPKVFTLNAGTHQLIIRGREANTRLGTISITAAPPKLQIRSVPGGPVVLSGTGQAGQKYNVLSSQNFTTWTPIGVVTTDASGSFTFTDPAGTSRPRCLYRLQRLAVTQPKLQIGASAGGPVVLSGTGQAGQTYNVQCSQNSKVWTVIGTVTIGASGSFAFADYAANTRPSSMYRLQGQ